MQPTDIRERKDSDIPALSAALVAVHQQDGYPVEGVDDPEAWLRIEGALGVWTATLDGQPVGQVALIEPGPADDAAQLLRNRDNSPTMPIAVLGRLFIAPEARGYALGRRLTETALRYAQSINRQAVLDVMEKDKAAIALYESLGWIQLGAIEHQYGDDLIAPARAYVGPSATTNNNAGS